MDCYRQAPPSMGLSQARILEWAAITFSGGLPDPRIEPTALQADSLLSEPPGKPGPCVSWNLNCVQHLAPTFAAGVL